MVRRYWYKFLILFYRALGSSDVQAEWRARRALDAPEGVKAAVDASKARLNDRRYICQCGQLMVVGQRVCQSCGRKQRVPFGLRRLIRLLRGSNIFDGHFHKVALIIMALGYVVQVKVGHGTVSNPNTTFELYELGASFTELTLGPQLWRSVTYVYLHGGIFHILMNAYVLWAIGPAVENVFGTARFAFGWVFTGAAAVLIPGVLGLQSVVVGASGAVFGLMGMALIFGHQLGTSQGVALRNQMFHYLVLTTLFGFMIGGIAHDAHFAGMAAGVGVGYFFPPERRGERPSRVNVPLGLATVCMLVGGLLSFWGWYSTGRIPPSSASPQLQASLLYSQARNRGMDKVIDNEGMTLLEDARRIRRLGYPPTDLAALTRRAESYLTKLEAPKAQVFRQELVDRLYPNGLPAQQAEPR